MPKSVMTKGVIVQLDYDTAHILKNDGAFVSCPRNALWQIGDVVTVSRRPMISLKILLIACGVFLCLLAGTGITLFQIPTTYIEVSVNPSVQFTLNRFDRVLAAKGLTTDGEELLQGVSYDNLPFDEAYARLLNRLDNNGYLTDATLQLVIANNSQRRIDDVEQGLRGSIEKYGQLNGLQISIKRFANDEYLSLEHPIPIMTIPIVSSQEPPGQQTAPPITETPPASSSEALTSQPEETQDTTPSEAPAPPESTQPTPPPSSNPTTPPTTPHHGEGHGGNSGWNPGEWRNGWWDWDCCR